MHMIKNVFLLLSVGYLKYGKSFDSNEVKSSFWAMHSARNSWHVALIAH